MINKTDFYEISNLDTEAISPEFECIDKMETLDILNTINTQDKLVPNAITLEIPYISVAVDAIVQHFKMGGRLLYFGAGTSGRLGILDASECPPTFSTPPDLVQGFIAGGRDAAFAAIEGAEDDTDAAISLVEQLQVTEKDVVCGITASGRTPFVIAVLNKAKTLGAFTILISTNSRSKLTNSGIDVDVLICPNVGPEVIAGSTRMKSGTAQKLILNMLTTTAMIKMGKTLKNIMIDLASTNEKLKQRAKRIVMLATGCTLETATNELENANYIVKDAIKNIIG
ncbi:MAG: N-acetylmuramic acid 6-phosphate etherase [Ignavibacteria bacterium]|nr:N-acetylmuramic acid 6-phosphate etherase [Ignavibacteria bacterium]